MPKTGIQLRLKILTTFSDDSTLHPVSIIDLSKEKH